MPFQVARARAHLGDLPAPVLHEAVGRGGVLERPEVGGGADERVRVAVAPALGALRGRPILFRSLPLKTRLLCFNGFGSGLWQCFRVLVRVCKLLRVWGLPAQG